MYFSVVIKKKEEESCSDAAFLYLAPPAGLELGESIAFAND